MKQATISLYQGADFRLQLTIVNSIGAGIDLTGYSFLGQIRTNTDPLNPGPIANFTFTLSDQTDPATIGQLEWGMPKATIATLPVSISNAFRPTPYIYDVKMQDTSGVVSRIIQGQAQVFAQVTQVPFT